MLLSLSRPFGRSLGRRIVMQLISIGCLFMLICLHLQYEFTNRAAASSRLNRHSSLSNQRNYEKRFPTDDDERLIFNDKAAKRERMRTRRDEEDDNDDIDLLYIDIFDEQKNSVDAALSRGVGGAIERSGMMEEEKGNKGGSGYQLGRKALLSKRISSIGDEYAAEVSLDSFYF